MEKVAQWGASYFVHITGYYYADQTKENEVGKACGMHGRGGELYMVLVGKPEGKRPRGRPRRRWEDGVKTDLTETGCKGVEWFHLA
jgi:hypothetical protein